MTLLELLRDYLRRLEQEREVLKRWQRSYLVQPEALSTSLKRITAVKKLILKEEEK